MIRRFIAPLIVLATALIDAGQAQAQLTIPVLQPVIPFNYSRGRNVSVADRDRPEYQAVGVDAGGFTIFPRLDLGIGFTDNVFETNLEKRSSAFVSITPTVKALSNWSRDSLQAEAGGDLRRYTSYSVRNQSGWHVSSTGRLDVGSDSSISATGATRREYETRFSGSTTADVASAVPYQISIGQLSGTTNMGRVRLIGVADFSNVAFSPITRLDGTTLGQRFRNRNVWTGSGQADYALTPDVSLFGKVSYTDTNYYTGLAVGPNDRSSRQIQGLAGISLDISALVRGSFGIGYTDRDYHSPLYGRVSGLSLESRVEFFPSQLTTVTVAARRAIEDSQIVGSGGFFNTGAGVRIDHEFLRNLIANIGVDYEKDDYRGIDATARIFAVNAGAHYLLSRSFGFAATVSYGQRHSSGVTTGPVFNETTAMLSFFVQK